MRRAAIHRAVSALRRAQEIERQGETYLEHARNQPAVRLYTATLPATAPTRGSQNGPAIASRVSGLDHAVRVDRYHDLAAGTCESGFERGALAAILRKALGRKQARDTGHGYALNMLQVRTCCQSSMTKISSAFAQIVCRGDESIERATMAPSLYAGITTVRLGASLKVARGGVLVAEPEQGAKQQHQHVPCPPTACSARRRSPQPAVLAREM